MPRAPRELSQSKILLDVFGVSYSDGREKFLPFNILSNWPAMLFGVPVVKLSQGMGTFNNLITRVSAKWMLRKCKKVFARGAHSYTSCATLGLGDRLELASDVAFLFRDEDALTVENPEREQELISLLGALRAQNRKILALSISSVVFQKCQKSGIDYIAELRKVAQHFIRKHYTVVLHPHATREGLHTLHNNDIPVVNNLAAQIQPGEFSDSLVAINYDLNSRSLRHVIAASDWLVASRFHAMVAGLALGIPTMVIGWGHKYNELMDQFGLRTWVYDYTQLDAAALCARIEALITEGNAIKTMIQSHLADVRNSAHRQFDWTNEFLKPTLTLCTQDE
jgi:polysaccharide pyruvyl transferase WcaK-like protein